MAVNLSNLEFQLFQKYIKESCGISIGTDKAYLIESRLSKLLIDSGMRSFEEFYHTIVRNKDSYISVKVIDAITTNETLWFRDQTPWKILENVYLPVYIEELRNGKKQKIRIWSAAASTGQEAYSTAMCIDDYLFRKGIRDVSLSHFEIIATDISQTVLDIAKRGRYDSISIMRGLGNEYKEKYFRKEGMAWELSDKIKNIVKFQQFNLQNSFLFLGKFDVIFCRYVLIYFEEALQKEIGQKILNSLDNQGIFFIGASELYSNFDQYFEMVHMENGTYYRKR